MSHGAEAAAQQSVDDEEVVVYLTSVNLRDLPGQALSWLRGQPRCWAQLIIYGSGKAAVLGVGYDCVVLSSDVSSIAIGARLSRLPAGTYRVSYHRFRGGCPPVELATREHRQPPAHPADVAPTTLRLFAADGALNADDRLQLVIQQDIGINRLACVYRSDPVRIIAHSGLWPAKPAYRFLGQRACDIAACLLLTLSVTAFLGWLLIPYFLYLRVRHGHVFYRGDSRWVRRNGRLTEGTIYKIETMFTAAGGGRRLIGARVDRRSGCWSEPPLTTLVPRFLRRFGLDELPQLWNVWKGEWSLWGPRASKNGTYPLPDGGIATELDCEARYGDGCPGLFSSLVSACGRGYAPPNAATRLAYDNLDRQRCSFPHSIKLIARTACHCCFDG
jgi:lipopolysaccharide/colanic/teichoic acid biosynthesis glycosyltransferase